MSAIATVQFPTLQSDVPTAEHVTLASVDQRAVMGEIYARADRSVG